MHDANCRIENDLKKSSKDIHNTYERLVALERY